MTLLRVPAFSLGDAGRVGRHPARHAGLPRRPAAALPRPALRRQRPRRPTTVGALPLAAHAVAVRPTRRLPAHPGPASGRPTDIVTTHARRPLLDHRFGLVALGLFGALSLTVFGVGDKVTQAVIVPTYAILTSLVVAPLGVIVLLWLGTMALGRPRFHVSLLFVAGALLLWVFGAANAVIAAFEDVAGYQGNSAWVAGNAHVVVFGAPTLLGVGALYHWSPKILRPRPRLHPRPLAFLCLFVGFLLSGLAYYLLGYNGARIGQLSGISSYQKGLYGLAEAGGAVIVLGVLIVLADLVASRRGGERAPAGDDPYEGLTLEWATTSPPPRHGFDTVPEVRSPAPLLDLRRETASAADAPSGGLGPSARTALPRRGGRVMTAPAAPLALGSGVRPRPRNVLNLTVLMVVTGGLALFAALIGAYSALSGPPGRGHRSGVALDDYVGSMLSITAVMSAVTVEWACYAVKRDDPAQATWGLGLTFGFGLAFLDLLWFLGRNVHFGPGDAKVGPYAVALLRPDPGGRGGRRPRPRCPGDGPRPHRGPPDELDPRRAGAGRRLVLGFRGAGLDRRVRHPLAVRLVVGRRS